MTNLTQVGHVGEEWGSSTMVEFAASLSVNATTANAGSLNGHRHFFSNDYTVCPTNVRCFCSVLKALFQVHRGSNYVSTLKMYSSRTKNTEYTNTQNVRTCTCPEQSKANNIPTALRLSPRRRDIIHLRNRR
jgi:hypothetical protein